VAPTIAGVSDDIRQRNLEAVRRAFRGVSNADADEMLANYTEDLVLETPYADPPMVHEGRENIRAYLKGAFEVFKFRLDITEVFECADPDMLVLEYVSDGTVTTTGKPYANRYIGVYWFRDGAICKVREFYNPLLSQRAMEP
jgi:ketosteroid isomerase-like protein